MTEHCVLYRIEYMKREGTEKFENRARHQGVAGR